MYHRQGSLRKVNKVTESLPKVNTSPWYEGTSEQQVANNVYFNPVPKPGKKK